MPGAGQIKAVDEGFGTDTAPDRTIIAGLEPKSGLVLAGRLALGRIIGTEAIHDCFEGDLDLWTAEMKFQPHSQKGRKRSPLVQHGLNGHSWTMSDDITLMDNGIHNAVARPQKKTSRKYISLL